MSRYFFHTIDGQRSLDRAGTWFESGEEAKREAVRRAGAWISANPDLLVEHHDCRMEVTNEAERVFFTLVMFSVDPKIFGHRV